MSEKIATREAYGKALVELGAVNDKVVVLDADLAGATMTKHFKAAYPERFFDCGIAEANMMNIGAGLSTMGLVPFCSTFAMFGAGRAYEQIRNSIAYPKFNVKICCSHAGVSVGEDGGSHQAIEDIGLMRLVPGMTVIVRRQGVPQGHLRARRVPGSRLHAPCASGNARLRGGLPLRDRQGQRPARGQGRGGVRLRPDGQ